MQDIEIAQRISDNPISSLLKREVRVKYFLPQFGEVFIKDGNIVYTDTSIRAIFQVCEFIETSNDTIYTSIKDLPYECSSVNKINPINIATGELQYVTDPSTPGFDLLPTEKDFVLNLLIKISSGMTVSNIMKLFIANLDTRSTGSVFNF